MTFIEAQEISNTLYANLADLSAALKVFPMEGPMGLPTETVRLSPEYRDAKSKYDAAFAKLRQFNGWYLKTFKKEIKAARRA